MSLKLGKQYTEHHRLFQVLLVLFILEAMSASESETFNGCRQPSRRKMRRIRSNFIRRTRRSPHDSFGTLAREVFHQNLYDVDSKWKHSRSLNITESTCPTHHHHVETPCPHYYVLDVDENRIPKVILQAKCKCDKCLDMDKSFSEHSHPGCSPVQYFSRVLRVTGCHNGILKYSEVWEPVAVACTCRSQRHIPVTP